MFILDFEFYYLGDFKDVLCI